MGIIVHAQLWESLCRVGKACLARMIQPKGCWWFLVLFNTRWHCKYLWHNQVFAWGFHCAPISMGSGELDISHTTFYCPEMETLSQNQLSVTSVGQPKSQVTCKSHRIGGCTTKMPQTAWPLSTGLATTSPTTTFFFLYRLKSARVAVKKAYLLCQVQLVQCRQGDW